MLLQFGEYSILLVVHGGDAGLLGFGEDVDDQSRVNVEEVLPHHGLIPCQRETAEVLDKPSQWRKKLGLQSKVKFHRHLGCQSELLEGDVTGPFAETVNGGVDCVCPTCHSRQRHRHSVIVVAVEFQMFVREPRVELP